MERVRYVVPEDGDEFDHPNVFELAATGAGVRVGDVRRGFPLPGPFHLRFKRRVAGLVVWADAGEDVEAAPRYDGAILVKASRVAAGAAAPAAAPRPAAAGAARAAARPQAPPAPPRAAAGGAPASRRPPAPAAPPAGAPPRARSAPSVARAAAPPPPPPPPEPVNLLGFDNSPEPARPKQLNDWAAFAGMDGSAAPAPMAQQQPGGGAPLDPFFGAPTPSSAPASRNSSANDFDAFASFGTAPAPKASSPPPFDAFGGGGGF